MDRNELNSRKNVTNIAITFYNTLHKCLYKALYLKNDYIINFWNSQLIFDFTCTITSIKDSGLSFLFNQLHTVCRKISILLNSCTETTN